MSSYYYKDAGNQLVGPVPLPSLLELKASGALPEDTPVCHAETEAWTTLADEKITPAVAAPGDGTLSFQFIPSLTFIAVFIFLAIVASSSTSIPYHVPSLFYCVIHWLFLLSAIILFRLRHGSIKTFWWFLVLFLVLGLFRFALG
jgi:hypothetical protein